MPSISARIAIKESGFLSSKFLISVLKAVLTAGVLLWLIRALEVDRLLETLRHANLGPLVIAAALLPVNILLQVWKWRELLRLLDRRCTWSQSWFSLIAGYPLGLVTPGRWGELGRAFFLKEFDKLQVVQLAAVDKIYNLLCVILAGGAAFYYFHVNNSLRLPNDNMARALLILVPALGLVTMTRLGWRSLLRLLSVFSKNRVRSASHLDSVGRRPVTLVWCLSMMFVATYCLQFVIVLGAFSELPTLAGLAGAAATFLAKSALPIAIGDLGIREGAAVFFFNKLGVAPQAAFSASLILFAINLGLPSLAGLCCLCSFKTAEQA